MSWIQCVFCIGIQCSVSRMFHIQLHVGCPGSSVFHIQDVSCPEYCVSSFMLDVLYPVASAQFCIQFHIGCSVSSDLFCIQFNVGCSVSSIQCSILYPVSCRMFCILYPVSCWMFCILYPVLNSVSSFM